MLLHSDGIVDGRINCPALGYAVGYGLRNVVFGGEIAFFNRGRNLFADGVLDGVA